MPASPPTTPSTNPPPATCGACCGANPSAAAAAAPPADSPDTTTWRLPAMDCASEEGEIRQALEGLDGVRALHFQLGERTLRIDADADALALALAAIRRAGFTPEPLATPGQAAAAPGTASPAGSGLLKGAGRLALALVLALAAEALAAFGPEGLAWRLGGQALAISAIALAGAGVYRKGLAALRQGRLNINALMMVAVTGAFVIGQWPEAAMVMALYALAELIEARAVDRARSAIAGLMALAPATAQLQQPDGTWQAVPVAQVPLGATVRVRPGERIPLDGVVRDGHTTVDQAPVTGESLPVDKGPGDTVFAGTINVSGTLQLQVSAAASQSTLARIIQAVEQAQGSRAPTQRWVDAFAARYTPAVFVLALAVALVGPIALGWPVLTAIYKALVLLVIACPCALVISTPVTVVSALAASARRGVLIKGGAHLERARLLRAIALDKTGTLTEGRPRLVEWQALDPHTARDDAEHLAAVLARHSDHPVSRAVAAGLQPNHVNAVAFKALSGRGIEAEVGGQRYVLGNHRLIEERGQCTPAIEAALQAHENAGRTVSLLASEQAVIALFAVADTVRPSAAPAVAALKALGITPVMLSGDNQATAEAIARAAGIDTVQGNLLPQDKLTAVAELQRRHGPTAMTGDGINDAPALAQADLGIAMGATGTDIAIEAADVVVMNDDLRHIAELVQRSRQTWRVLWQNIVLALGIKAVFFVLALTGAATLWMAVFADMGASLLVVANGLRLLRR